MPHLEQHLFGPGSLEMLRLDLWSSKLERRPEGDALRIKGRLVGQYDIFCGSGNQHRIDIKVEDSVWSTEVGKYTDDFIRARAGQPQAAERIATTLIEWELEEWSDPCGDTQARLEYLRGEIDAERISMEEIVELQGMADSIDPSDVQLLEWAGVPEFEEEA